MSGDAGLCYVVRRLYRGEQALLEQLTGLAERHAAEHEVHHVARDLARWSRENLRGLDTVAGSHDIDLEPVRGAAAVPPDFEPPDVEQPGVQLLEDLRETYLRAAGNSLAWDVLGQYAQAKRLADVLQLAASCHPQTLRQLRWADTMLKTVSPQALGAL